MKPMMVEAKDVQFFERRQVSEANGPAVAIKGLVFHSSLAVERIDQVRVAEEIVLEVWLTPARAGLSGSFEVTVPTQGVKRILFGPGREQIWPIPAR